MTTQFKQSHPEPSPQILSKQLSASTSSSPIKCTNKQQVQISQFSSLELSMSESGGGDGSPDKNGREGNMLLSVGSQGTKGGRQGWEESNLLDSTVRGKIDDSKQQKTNNIEKSVIPPSNGQQTDITFHQGQSQPLTSSSKELILQAQLISLQLKCTTLLGIIHKICKHYNIQLADVEGLEVEESQLSVSMILGHEDGAQGGGHDCERSYGEEVEGLGFLEGYVERYRGELEKYQASVKEVYAGYEQKIKQFSTQVTNLQTELTKKQQQLQQQIKSNQQMFHKNEQLLLQLQKLQAKPPSRSHSQSPKIFDSRLHHTSFTSPPVELISTFPFPLDLNLSTSRYSRIHRCTHDESFTVGDYQKCVEEMETIIGRLVKGMEVQKRARSKLVEEIERLCGCVRGYEAEIKDKNQIIYDLEKKIIMGQTSILQKSKQHLERSSSSLTKQKLKQSHQKYLKQSIRESSSTNMQMSYKEYYQSRDGDRERERHRDRDRDNQHVNGSRKASKGYGYKLNRPRPSSNGKAYDMMYST